MNAAALRPDHAGPRHADLAHLPESMTVADACLTTISIRDSPVLMQLDLSFCLALTWLDIGGSLKLPPIKPPGTMAGIELQVDFGEAPSSLTVEGPPGHFGCRWADGHVAAPGTGRKPVRGAYVGLWNSASQFLFNIAAAELVILLGGRNTETGLLPKSIAASSDSSAVTDTVIQDLPYLETVTLPARVRRVHVRNLPRLRDLAVNQIANCASSGHRC